VRNSLDYFDPAEPIIIAGDETKCKRAGNKVKRSRWVRDSLSPPFHVNFIKGIRFVMSFKVIRATAPELAVQMVGGAHPTRCVARRSNTPGILASRALRDGCLDHFGASLYLCPRPLSRRLEPGCWRSVCSWFPSVSGSESGSIPIPTVYCGWSSRTATIGPIDIRDRCTVHIQFLMSKSHPLFFDPDPDPDYNPYRDRDAFVLY
jgi:hypothetical protein